MKISVAEFDMDEGAAGLAVDLLSILRDEVPDPAERLTVYIRDQDGHEVNGAVLERETLTDGSFVYNLVLRFVKPDLYVPAGPAMRPKKVAELVAGDIFYLNVPKAGSECAAIFDRHTANPQTILARRFLKSHGGYSQFASRYAVADITSTPLVPVEAPE